MKTQNPTRVLATRERAWKTLLMVAALALLSVGFLASAMAHNESTPFGAGAASGDAGASAGNSGLAATTQALMKQVRMDNRLNAQVPLDVRFTDDKGQTVRFGNYFGDKPVMLLMISYACRLLCDVETENLQAQLKDVTFKPGKEFNLVVMSIDPQETPKMAAASKANFLKGYGKSGVEGGVHFLTGDKASIHAVTDAVGYRFAYDPSTRQWIHPATTVLLTPEGKVALYFNKLNYTPRDLRLGLVQTASDKIGTVFDTVLLTCLHYSPSTGRYTVAVMDVLRVFGVLVVLGMALGIAIFMLRERRDKLAELAAAPPKSTTKPV